MLVERLAALGLTEPPPSWAQLRSVEQDLLDQAGQLPATCLAVLTELVAQQWDELPPRDRSTLTAIICHRVVEIEDPLTFASALDRAVAIALASEDEQLVRQLGDALLPQVRQYLIPDADNDDHLATRARFCLSALGELVCADALTPYGLMSVLDELRLALPAQLASSAARVAGRLADQSDDPLYRSVIEAASAHPEALADASVELGHAGLRVAAMRNDPDAALANLAEANTRYRDAIAADEFRPDARAFEAAVDLVMAFVGGASTETLNEPADRLMRAAGELALYVDPNAAPSRPLVDTASWLALAARIRGAAEVLDHRNVLDLRAGLLSLLELYANARIRIIGSDLPGLSVLIGPRIEDWVREHTLGRAALQQLCEQLPDQSDAHRAGLALLEVTVDTGKAWKSRSRPGWPGGLALVD